LECQTLEQICTIWGLGGYCRKRQLEFQAKGMLGRRDVIPEKFNEISHKRMKLDGEENQQDILYEIKCAFIRVNFPKDPDLPKSTLIAYCGKNKLKVPRYRIINEDKLFRAVANLEGKSYSSTYWEKNKRFAEQGAALACCVSLGLISKQSLIDNGSILE